MMVEVNRRASFAVLIAMLIATPLLLSGPTAARQELGSDVLLANTGVNWDANTFEGSQESDRMIDNLALSYRVERRWSAVARSCAMTGNAAVRSSVGVVDAAYCRFLSRLPDKDGRSYWGTQLESGLPLVRLIATIQEGEEYRRRNNHSLLKTLNKVGISAERVELRREAELEAKAQSAAAELEVKRELAAKKQAAADAARRAAEQKAISEEASRKEATLMKRSPMSVNQFKRFVTNRNFSSAEYLTPSMVHGTYTTSNQKVNVILVHLSGSKGFSVSPGDRAKSSVGSWAIDIGAQAAINGNWFDPYDGPAVSSGKVYGGSDHGYTSLFGITLQKDLIVEHHTKVNHDVDSRIAFGVSGHPTLVYKGTKTTSFGSDPTFTGRAPRTAMGANSQGDILMFVTVDGRSTTAAGMTGAETANLMVRLGSANAVMLDGGGSTTMWIAGRGIVNQPSTSTPRVVANQVAIFGS